MKGKRGAALTLAALAASGFFAGCSVPGQTGNAAGSQTAGNGAQDEEGSRAARADQKADQKP